MATVAMLVVMAGEARAQLVVEQDLGPLPFGITNVTGDTSTGANNADIYSGLTLTSRNWLNELVYQFTLADELSVVNLTLNASDPVGFDPDFFLLTGLTTGVEDGKNSALEAIDGLFLDFGPESFGLVSGGTYFLSVDSFGGADGNTFDTPGTFDLDIEVVEVVTPDPVIDLGVIANANQPFTIDTLGSDFDTELGLFDAPGFLLANNDDAPGGVRHSQLDIAGLDEGQYFVALGGFDTLFVGGFQANPKPDSEGGSYLLNYPGGQATGNLAVGTVEWFGFQVVPEPTTLLLAMLCGLAIAASRPRR